MIKNEKMMVYISYRNKTHYLKLGYKPIIDKYLEVKTVDLPPVSHVRIEVICQICLSENQLSYNKYIKNCQRHGFYSCKKCSRQKAVMTSRQLYGVDNWMQLEEAKEIMKEKNLEKYGSTTTLLVADVKRKIEETLLEKYGTKKWFEIRTPNNTPKFNFLELVSKEFDFISPETKYKDISMKSMNNYRNEVRRITKSYSFELFECWDGKDFYDGEYIYENFKLESNDKRYPTIDHKISIYFGFVNKIPAEEIGHISNLCITKRSINSTKRTSCEYVNLPNQELPE